jgi:hypothetical protein
MNNCNNCNNCKKWVFFILNGLFLYKPSCSSAVGSAAIHQITVNYSALVSPYKGGNGSAVGFIAPGNIAEQLVGNAIIGLT